MTETIIKTPYHRELTVIVNRMGDTYLGVKETEPRLPQREVNSFLSQDNKAELAAALLGDSAVIAVSDLPEVELYGGYVVTTGHSRSESADPEELMKTIKAMLAIHAELVRLQEAQKAAEAEKAKAAAEKQEALNARRDKVAQQISGDDYRSYAGCSTIFRAAINRIIELEDAAKV